MPRHVAFLRGINLGKRRVKMDVLRSHFEEFGIEAPKTFLASGNVIFRHSGSGVAELESKLERHLESALGYEVKTLIRPMESLSRLTELEAVSRAEARGFTPHVVFTRTRSEGEGEEKLEDLETEDDRFHRHGSEVLWFRRGGLRDSSVSTADLEKALGSTDQTMRNLNTVRRIVEKYGGEGAE